MFCFFCWITSSAVMSYIWIFSMLTHRRLFYRLVQGTSWKRACAFGEILRLWPLGNFEYSNSWRPSFHDSFPFVLRNYQLELPNKPRDIQSNEWGEENENRKLKKENDWRRSSVCFFSKGTDACVGQWCVKLRIKTWWKMFLWLLNRPVITWFCPLSCLSLSLLFFSLFLTKKTKQNKNLFRLSLAGSLTRSSRLLLPVQVCSYSPATHLNRPSPIQEKMV